MHPLTIVKIATKYNVGMILINGNILTVAIAAFVCMPFLNPSSASKWLWKSPECPYGRNFWIGCDMCSCSPEHEHVCANLKCAGAKGCPTIPEGALWLLGACNERCDCEKRTGIIHCERYCPITDGYHFFPRAGGLFSAKRRLQPATSET